MTGPFSRDPQDVPPMPERLPAGDDTGPIIDPPSNPDLPFPEPEPTSNPDLPSMPIPAPVF